MTTTFLLMYHPLIPSTITTPVRVAAQAVDEQAALGWLLVSGGALPDPVTPYYTKEALLSQIQGGASPIGTALRAAFVPKWKPNTAYASGEPVINPSGQLVTANTSFTSGASYSAGNWTVTAGGGAGGSSLTVAATVTASGALVTGKHNPVNATSGVKAMTLPTGAASGTLLSVEKTDASTNAVTVTGNVRGVGSTTISLVWQNEALLLAADSAGSWWPVAGHKTKTSLDAAYLPVDATTGAKGILQLAGALGGTAASPTALGLADNAALLEQIRDTMGVTLVAGANVTKTVDDAGDTVTLSALRTPPGGFVTGSPGVRRAMLAFGGASGKSDPFLASGANSMIDRRPVELPVSTTRWRLRISQWNAVDSAYASALISVAGVYVGLAALATTGDPNGNFTATPVSALGAFTTNADGTEYVTGWVTDPTAQFQANTLHLLSLGWTSTSTTIAKGYGMWFFQKQTGAATRQGDIAPAGGLAADGQQWFDMRLEYEYAGDRRTRLAIGDSLTEVYPGSSAAGTAIPPYVQWPLQAALRDNAPTTASACTGRTALQMSASNYWFWTRLGTELTVDDAIIFLGSNDSFQKFTLANFQTNYAAVVAIARTYAKGAVYAVTVPPRTDFVITAVAATVASGVTAITTTATTGTGLATLGSGATAEVVTVSSVTGTGPYTLNLSAATTQAHNAGDIVLGPQETARQQYNTWLRTMPLGLNGIVDADVALRDPARPNYLLYEVTGADGVHIPRGGQARLAGAVRMPVVA